MTEYQPGVSKMCMTASQQPRQDCFVLNVPLVFDNSPASTGQVLRQLVLCSSLQAALDDMKESDKFMCI